MSGSSDDDLFQQTVQDVPAIGASGKKPWRSRSQFVPSFFGGPFAATALAWVNSGRLGVPEAKRRWILVAGIAVGLASAAFVALSLPSDWTAEALREHGSERRLSSRVAGIAAYGIFHWIQATYDRLHSVNSPLPEDQDYDSLWVPGVLAVIGGTVAEFALALVLALLLR